MTRFKNALLNELVAYTQLPVQDVNRAPSPRRRIVRTASLAGVAATAAVAAFLVSPSAQEPAYAVERNPDGTVTVTFRELGHAAEATRDLRAAGVPAQVVRLAAPGSCATTPGGIPLEPQPGTAWSTRMPSAYPYDGNITDWLKGSSPTTQTFNPSAIPAGAVLFIIEHSTPQSGVMVEAGLVNAPAPTCWEAAEQSPRGPRN